MHPFAPTQLTPCFLYFTNLLHVVYYVAIHTLPIFLYPHTMSPKKKLNQFHKMLIMTKPRAIASNKDNRSHPKPS